MRKLSGGMKRQLGIAQALLHDPQVLIADEPTVGLDTQEWLRFHALLNEFSSNRIVVVSSHIVSDIETVCEKVAVLDAGKLLFTGTVEDLAQTAAGKVYELTVPKSRQASIQNQYCVLSSQGHLADVKIRVLHDSVPTVGDPVTCEATVEDGNMKSADCLERMAALIGLPMFVPLLKPEQKVGMDAIITMRPFPYRMIVVLRVVLSLICTAALVLIFEGYMRIG